MLRGLEPAVPRVGAWGRYRFTAEEPAGARRLVFDAGVERIAPGPDGSICLRLVSGDSLDALVELAPAFFAGRGGSLLEHVRSIVEIAAGDTTRLDSEAWSGLPGLDRAPPLPGSRDSVLAPRDLQVGDRTLRCQGRTIREANVQVRPLGNVQMTQSARRQVETWSAAGAPLLGLVRAEATIRSERILSAPVPGVPQAGPRTWHYRLELLDIGPPGKLGRRR